MAAFHLREDEIEHYRREGYLVVERVFTPEEIAEVLRAIDEVVEAAFASGDPSSVLELEPESDGAAPVPRRIYDPFERHEGFRRLATDPRILDRIESLIGPDIGLHHSKLNVKPARVGSVVEWHQDLAYFPHTNDDLVTTLVYLDDADLRNGCLQVLPRHHHHYFDHTLPDGTFAGMITEDLDSGRFGRPVPLAAPRGSAIFMHCLLPHSSLPNRSERPRRTLIFEYRAADAFPIYYSERVVPQEALARHLRGKKARFARFGGPPQFVPDLLGRKSLYQLQEEARRKAQAQASGGGSPAAPKEGATT